MVSSTAIQLRTALVQLNSGDRCDDNLRAAAASIDRAAVAGARFVALPELWTYLGPYEGYDVAARAFGPAMAMLQAKAREHCMVIHGGSAIEADPGAPGRFFNTSLLVDADGHISGTYHKIHLFDADPANGRQPHRESERITAGDDVVCAEVDGVVYGFAICYDLRFPELFRALALRGAQIVVLPAAFTLHTGRDHWEVLLRARAIENQCYVAAPAQVGRYLPDRVCFGRSMIVDPWGLVVAQAPDHPTVLIGDIDLSRIEVARSQVPSLEHRRPEVYAADRPLRPAALRRSPRAPGTPR